MTENKRQAIFAGLIQNENGDPVDVAYLGDEAFYVIPDGDFRRHVEASQVDEEVLRQLRGQMAGMEDQVVDGVLKTPPLEDGMLAGITRAVVLDVAARAGIPCEQVSLRVNDLLAADECFLTGTGAELIAVRQIDDQVLPVAQTRLLPVIMQGFKNCIAEYCANP